MKSSIIQGKGSIGIGGIFAIYVLALLSAVRMEAQPWHARSINVHPLWSAPYNLNGDGMHIGIFELSHLPIKNHSEFLTPTAKITYVSPTSGAVRWHPTQIVGLILAKGGNPDARGVATKATANMYVCDGSIKAFLANAGIGTWLVSSHSYGINRGWRQGTGPNKGFWEWIGTIEASGTNTAGSEDRGFGYYDVWARRIDSILFARPTQIPVVSSGNQRGLGPDEPIPTYKAVSPGGASWVNSNIAHPKNGANGYDVLAGHGLAKNVITVGAIDSNNVIWEHSNTGPTDDGRIKPDVVAPGEDVTVCSSPTTATGFDPAADGTSYSAPVVAGSVLLLSQYWKSLFPSVPFNSSTARGLLIHTAEDLGKSGPDYQYGWGKIDAKDAADLIKRNSTNGGFTIRQATLEKNKTFEFYVKGYAYQYLRLTLAWTDPAGTPVSFVSGAPPLDDSTRMLVNDLDIRLYPSKGSVPNLSLAARPYILDRKNPSDFADKGDNNTDNVEQIYFRSINPYGMEVLFEHTYKVVISHKGTLEGDKQNFSLIVSGAVEYLPPPPSVSVSTGGTIEKTNSPLANSAFVSWKGVAGASKYDVQYRTVGSVSWTTLSNVTGTEALLNNLQSATYQVRVRARNGNVVSLWTDIVQFFGGDPVAPESAWYSNLTTTTAKINWTSVPGVTQYNVKWARIAGDNTVLGSWKSLDVNGTSTTLSLLVPDGRYVVYVRSKYSNNLYSDWAPATSFYTLIGCSDYEASNTPLHARTLRIGDFPEGLLCKGDDEDWYKIYNPTGYNNLQVILYEHTKPYRLAVYRSPKGSGDVSLLPGSPPAGIGTKIFELNGANFTNYDYYVQVWVADANVTYSDTETYLLSAHTQGVPYSTAEGRDIESAKGVVGEESEAFAGVDLYPNPARTATTLRFVASEAGASTRVSILDVAGRELRNQTISTSAGSNEVNIPLKGLASGIYFVIVENHKGRIVRMLNVL